MYNQVEVSNPQTIEVLFRNQDPSYVATFISQNFIPMVYLNATNIASYVVNIVWQSLQCSRHVNNSHAEIESTL